MAICAAGALATLSVNNDGDADSGPSQRICLSSASVFVEGPNAVARTTAVPSSSMPAGPAQRSAMRAAATASFDGGLIRRPSAGESQATSWPGGTRQARRAPSGR
jgi:hypothetical protein